VLGFYRSGAEKQAAQRSMKYDIAELRRRRVSQRFPGVEGYS
jgi:hypothetical protein